jgi:hypothetical protein
MDKLCSLIVTAILTMMQIPKLLAHAWLVGYFSEATNE